MKPETARWMLVGCWLAMAHAPLGADDAPRSGHDGIEAATSDAVAADAPEDQGPTGRRHVLIIVGLPGDAEHAQQFDATVEVWRRWLESAALADPEDVVVLSGSADSNEQLRSTAANIRARAQQLTDEISEEDAFWLFLVGHGSHDRRQTWFHLPGSDLHAGEWAGLFHGLKAHEQVFWLTQSASGGFLKPMSQPGRVVMTATDSAEEVNETRFPHALAELVRGSFQADADDRKPATPADATSSGTVAELFRRVSEQVAQSFEGEQLVPTEHAQLDDNGDGVGTEADQLDAAAGEAPPDTPLAAPLDGTIAARIRISIAGPPRTTRRDDPAAPDEERSDE